MASRCRWAGGAGPGLALVHGLVTAMAGEVSVDSAPGEGTSVTVRLPVAASDGSDIAAGPPGPGVRSGRG